MKKKVLVSSVIMVLVFAAGIFLILFHNDESREVSRIQEILYERYNTNFVYEGKEQKEISRLRIPTLNNAMTSISGVQTLYYFHPSDNDKLRFYAVHGTGITEMVFSVSEYCYDNFKYALFEDVVKDKRLVYTEDSEYELVEEIYGIQTDLIEAAEKYGINKYDILITDQTMELKIECMGDTVKAVFSQHNKGKILACLRSTIKNESIEAVLLSSAGEDGSPAVWKTDECNCAKCGKLADYIFEFSLDGTYRIVVNCQTDGNFLYKKGYFEIKNNALINVIRDENNEGFSWLADIKEIKTEGKNTCIIITDPISYNENKTIKLCRIVKKNQTSVS